MWPVITSVTCSSGTCSIGYLLAPGGFPRATFGSSSSGRVPRLHQRSQNQCVLSKDALVMYDNQTFLARAGQPGSIFWAGYSDPVSRAVGLSGRCFIRGSTTPGDEMVRRVTPLPAATRRRRRRRVVVSKDLRPSPSQTADDVPCALRESGVGGFSPRVEATVRPQSPPRSWR